MLTLALEFALVSAAAAMPQGGLDSQLPAALAPRMSFPAEATIARFAPFVDPSGGPASEHIAAAGAVDFDGDGTDELWFVSAAGTHAGRFAVMMARGADLGRYRTYPGVVSPPGPAGWTDACTYSPAAGLPRVLLVDPSLVRPHRLDLRFLGSPTGHPRDSVAWETTESSLHASGGGTYEIEAGDHAGDGHPDVYTLTALPIGAGVTGTTVRRERLLPSGAGSILELGIPAVCDTLRVGDFDADGATDFALHVRGLGVAAFLDRGGWFAFAGGVPLSPWMLRDVVTGDADGDGGDELAIVLDGGVLLYRLLGPQTPWFDHVPAALVNPAGVGPLASAAIVDAYADPTPEVLVWPRDARSFAVHPYDPVMRSHTAPVVATPPDPAAYAGAGTQGQALVLADLDGDGDRDLAAQTALGAWFSMQGPAIDWRPLDVQLGGSALPDQYGMYYDHFTVVLPAGFAASGATDVEVALYDRDPVSARFGLRWAETLPIAAGGNGVSFIVTVKADGVPLPIPGLFTAGPALLSIHLRSGNQRFPSELFWYDGPPGGDGSAVGIRWRLVVAPPLPAVDDELLPWN